MSQETHNITHHPSPPIVRSKIVSALCGGTLAFLASTVSTPCFAQTPGSDPPSEAAGAPSTPAAQPTTSPVEASAPAPAPAAPPASSGSDALVEGPPPDVKAGVASQLKELVVTAERREASLQKVSTAITALSGDDLIDTGIGRTSADVLNYVPNASAATQQHGRPRWWIRGVGTGQQQLDFSNPIGFYLDEVYISNASATGFPLFDLERVEVLRGPQGTLWGKNTTGGAIGVVSRRPTFANDGYLKIDYGSFNNRLVQGASGGTIWENRLAARASFSYEKRDGRFENIYRDNRKDGEFQDGAVRLQLLGRITDNLEVNANVHFRDYTTAGSLATVTSNAADGGYLAGYVPSADSNKVNTNAPNTGNTLQEGSVVNVKWQLRQLTLTSISAYEQFRDVALTDSDYTPLEISRGWSRARSTQFTQELRLASPRADRFNWVGGLFGFYEDINRSASTAKLPGAAAGPGPTNYSNTVFDHTAKSLAAFGSGTYNFTQQLSLTAGLRWTTETRDLDINRVANSSPATFFDVGQWWLRRSVSSPLNSETNYDQNLSKTWNNFTGDVTPTFDINKNARVYLRYARGVKSGGFNTAATTLAALNVVEPEKLNAYEAGAKTSWFDNRLTANASAFHYDYRDIQVNVVGPLPPTNVAVSYLQNVKRGRSDGAELELEGVPFTNFHFGGSVGYLNTKFTDFKVFNSDQDYSNKSEFVRAPRWSTLFRADYRIPIARQALVLAGDWRFQTKQYHFTTNQDNPLLGQGAYSLVNARVSLVSADEKVTLTFYANNLLDEKYRNHSLPGARNATGAVTFYGDPLTVGVSLTTRWW